LGEEIGATVGMAKEIKRAQRSAKEGLAVPFSWGNWGGGIEVDGSSVWLFLCFFCFFSLSPVDRLQKVRCNRQIGTDSRVLICRRKEVEEDTKSGNTSLSRKAKQKGRPVTLCSL